MLNWEQRFKEIQQYGETFVDCTKKCSYLVGRGDEFIRHYQARTYSIIPPMDNTKHSIPFVSPRSLLFYSSGISDIDDKVRLMEELDPYLREERIDVQLGVIASKSALGPFIIGGDEPQVLFERIAEDGTKSPCGIQATVDTVITFNLYGLMVNQNKADIAQSIGGRLARYEKIHHDSVDLYATFNLKPFLDDTFHEIRASFCQSEDARLMVPRQTSTLGTPETGWWHTKLLVNTTAYSLLTGLGVPR